MIRRPPRSTRTDTLFPYTTLFRSHDAARRAFARHQPVALVERGVEREVNAVDPVIFARGAVAYIFDLEADRHGAARRHFFGQGEFGYTQVGFGIDDREARLAKIALRQFERIFGELTEQSAVDRKSTRLNSSH